MNRPVWLLSLDTDQFCAPPMTTGALKAYFLAHGESAAGTDVELVHFPHAEDVYAWLDVGWARHGRERAREALAAGLEPVVGLSCYTWNVAEFLEVARRVKADLPGVLVIAGGPHVQRAEDYLVDESIDVVVLGEGEEALCELLDCRAREQWAGVAGCAFLAPDGEVRRTDARPRATDLDRFPSALDVISLRGDDGRPRYRQVAYETSRGCPYRCAFCEWGTGAIGTKMYQFSLGRIRSDLERLVAGGVQDIWLCDSNFGALREDVEKARIFVELKERTGFPQTFATSWSKNHNQRVRDIVRMLHRAGLLWHYHLALQTLTERALELSHRKNMRANDYEPVVKALAAEGVPVTAELIWGLPGDNLAEYEAHLDHLFAVFPNINIFAYTLLPGTEFYERRDEYQLQTLPVAGYGKARGEYVVGCHTFSRDEGEEGYVMLSAQVMFSRGHVIPLLLRLLAQDRRLSVSLFLRTVLRALIAEFGDEVPTSVHVDRMAIYENRALLYLTFLAQPERMYATIRSTLGRMLDACGAADLHARAGKILELDEAICPRVGPPCTIRREYRFAADRVLACLGEMEVPAPELFDDGPPVHLFLRHPGMVGEVLIDPDGGSWMRGRLVDHDESYCDDVTDLAVQVAGERAGADPSRPQIG